MQIASQSILDTHTAHNHLFTLQCVQWHQEFGTKSLGLQLALKQNLYGKNSCFVKGHFEKQTLAATAKQEVPGLL